MTIDEQFHNVAHLLEQAAQLALRNEQAIKKCFEHAELQQRHIATLAETVSLIGNQQARLDEAHNRMTEEITGYVADSRERMKQMEAQPRCLDPHYHRRALQRQGQGVSAPKSGPGRYNLY